MAHSLSPVIHRAAWDSIGLPPDWEYRRCEVAPEELHSFVAELPQECLGLSVTMPHKQAIMPMLDVIDPQAQMIGVVNTVVHSAGITSGFNTDVYGITEALMGALRKQGRQGSLEGARGVVLGARATASSAIFALRSIGVTDIHVVGRSFSGQGSALVASHRMGVPIEQHTWSHVESVKAQCESADIVVSTVPARVCDDLAVLVQPRSGAVLLDVVYSPWRTRLVNAWEERGGVIAHGIDMLIHQAALQVRLMTGHDANIDVMSKAVMKAAGEE